MASLLQNVIDDNILTNQIRAFGGSFTSDILEFIYKFKEQHKINYGLSTPSQLGNLYNNFNKALVFIGENNHIIGTLDEDATYEEIEQMIGRSLASYEGIYLRENINNLILTEPSISIDLKDVFMIPDNIEPKITIYSNSDPYIAIPNILGTELTIDKTEFVGVSKIYIQIKVPDKDIMFRTSFHVFNSDNNHEDFEYSNLTESPYTWTNTGKKWEITKSEYFTGNHSLVSPEITDEDSTSVSVSTQIEEHGYISFAYKTSTEPLYDYLSFSIDGIEMENMETYSIDWAGENVWRTVFYNVRPGTRTFKWTYHKNYVSAHGEDKIWIDSIVLPGSKQLMSIEEDFTVKQLKLRNYPNPFNPTTTIDFSLDKSSKVKLNVYDINGSLVNKLHDGYTQNGKYSFEFNGKNLSSGIYYAVLITEKEKKISKMILVK